MGNPLFTSTASGLSFGLPSMGYGMPSLAPPSLTPDSLNFGASPVSTPSVAAPIVASAAAPTVPGTADDPTVPGTADDPTKSGVWGWLGENSDQMKNIAGLLGGAAQIWGAFQANKLAKQQMDFARTSFNTNLANQRTSYNTALEDRIRSRASTTGMSDADVQAYITKNSL